MEKNFLFYKRIIEEGDKKGKSINCIERDLGYPRNALHNYKEGRVPSGPRLLELSHYFNVSPEYLIGESKEKQNLNPKSLFKDLDNNQKYEILGLALEWCFKNLINHH